MTQDPKSLEAIARQTVDALSAWRDDVEVRIHLAGMDARDAWKATVPHLELAEARLRNVVATSLPESGQKVGKEIRAVLGDVREQLRKVRPSLEAIGHDLSEAGQEIVSRLERHVDSETRA